MDGNQHFHNTAAAIRDMAKRYGVAYAETRTDIWAHHVTRLADDEVVLDEIELLLIALYRAGHLSSKESLDLQVKYLRETKL